MVIPNKQLEVWSHPGSTAQSAETYHTIRRVLEDTDAPYHHHRFRVFLQGSYRNGTNVRGVESDVDIVICLTFVNYYDLSSLPQSEKDTFLSSRSPGKYSYRDFKRDVLGWLKKRFEGDVYSGKKAISVSGDGSRRDADVLVCFEHRKYFAFKSRQDSRFRKGVCFWPLEGKKVVNYPEQHRVNCTAKHQYTDSRFKPNVRVFKNLRKEMDRRGYLDGIDAPSYFIEGMLWNVPNNCYVDSYQDTFVNTVNWLLTAEEKNLMCANNFHYLIRDNASVCWNSSDYSNFINGVVKIWQEF